VLAQIELFTHTAKYPVGVYILPKHLDEKVARLQLAKLGAMLTELTDEQARYIGSPQEVPYKIEHYRYQPALRILIMGSGGVGGYFGARLQQAGHTVTFVARGRHLEALRADGLTLKSALGDARLEVDATDTPRDADVVLFAVKLWDTESA